MTNTMQLEGITLNYQDKEIEQLIESRNQDLQLQAAQQGKKDGFKNKPTPSERISSFTNFLTAGFNLLNNEVHSKLQAGNQLKFGAQDIEETKEKNQVLDLQNDELESQVKSLPKVKGGWPWGSILRLLGAVLLCGGIVLGEQEFIAKSLQITDSGWLSNRILAIGISTAILLVAHLSQKWISKIPNKWLRWAAIISEGILIGGVFMALAIFRQSYFEKVGQAGMPLWAFVLLNILFFYTFFLASTYILTPAINDLKSKFKDISNAIALKGLKNKQKKILEEVKENNANLHQQQRMRLSVLSYAKSTEQRIMRLHEQAISKYVQVNRDARTEAMPELNEPLPELNTHYQDINI